MLINQVTEQEKIYLQKKFDAFDTLLDSKKEALGYLKNDPTLFAYFFFKNDKNQRFRALPWQDKFLNSKSSRRLLNCARQIGKSTTAGIDAIHSAYFNPGHTILVVSRTKEQAMEFVYRIRKFLHTSSFTIWKDLSVRKNENKKEVILKSENRGIESRIIVVPCTDAALGYSANKVIGDEAARWENGDYVFREVIEPTTTMTMGSIDLLSTPAGKHGFFYECAQMTDIWDVFHFDWTYNPYLTEAYMAEKRKLHTNLSWAMNYLAQFVVSQSSYFTPLEIEKSINNEAGQGWKGETNVVVGVDFGKVHDKSIIDIGTVINPKAPMQDQIIRLLDRREKSLGTAYSVVLEELYAINRSIKPSTFVLDVTSGDTPSDLLRAGGVPTTPFKFTLQSKIDIMNNLKILMQQGRLQIPKETELINQLEMFEYTLSSENQDRMKLHAPDGFHDDEVDSLALMCYGLTNRCGVIKSSLVTPTVQPGSRDLVAEFSAYLQAHQSNQFI